MNKKRAALRRGIRELIEGTSRELVAFEGREPRPYPHSAGDTAPAATDDPRSAEISSWPASISSWPDAEPAGGPPSPPPGGPPADAAAEDSAAQTVPTSGELRDLGLLNGARAVSDRAVPDQAAPDRREAEPERSAMPAETASKAGREARAPDGDSGAPPAFELIAETVFLPPAPPAARPTPRGDEPPADRKSASRVPRSKPSRAKGPRAPRRGAARRRAKPEKRVRPAPVADDVTAEGVNPAQAESRTGVCRSYFVNRECWRVPDAYCNTALQVCVIRNCPVYHLHKDALERRFAKKFKHFW